MLEKTDKLIWSDYLASYRDYERLDEIRDELNFELPREILIYADLGLWNGRRTGYREIESGVLSQCFYSDYEPTWYVDKDNDLRCIDIHHDGTNYYLYRMYKEGISEEEKDELLENIYRGVATEEDIMELTEPIGPYINKIYPGTKPEEE